ncbi:MAG TPA: hypothetical protein VEB67_02700 [Nitrososphaerales archaeon]|nr:hypothetical protein [Nitrososphaerales archaeon]
MILLLLLLGVLSIVLGVFVLITGSRSLASMEFSLGSFRGPVWLLMFLVGIFFIGLGAL